MSWSFDHDWFKRYVENLEPGDIIRIRPQENYPMMWEGGQRKKKQGNSAPSFHIPHEYIGNKGKGISARFELDRQRFFIENFLGYTLTLRGLKLSPIRVFDAEGQRLKLIEKYGSAMAILGTREHKDWEKFWAEGERVHRAEYRVLKLK